jgi:hypothetical protein
MKQQSLITAQRKPPEKYEPSRKEPAPRRKDRLALVQLLAVKHIRLPWSPKSKRDTRQPRLAQRKRVIPLPSQAGIEVLSAKKFFFNERLNERAIKRHGSAEAASKWVLPPEKSNHPWGIAIDINYGVGGTKGKKAAAWLEKNGYQYGLCRRYENEWWHFEPLVAPGQNCPAMEPYAS